jgi:hypothetical protein
MDMYFAHGDTNRPRADHLTNVALDQRTGAGAPLRIEAKYDPQPTHWMDGKMDGGDEVAISPATFVLPKNADERFARFARAYHIDTRLEGLRSATPQWKLITKMRAEENC